jgi:hypothetical protein
MNISPSGCALTRSPFTGGKIQARPEERICGLDGLHFFLADGVVNRDSPVHVSLETPNG